MLFSSNIMTFWSQSDAYYEQEDEDSSDICTSTSSEDEIDIILHGTGDQKTKLSRLHRRLDDRKRGNDKKSVSNEDEFEEEMNAELAQQVDFMERNRDITSRLCAPTGSGEQGAKIKEQQKDSFYDDIYFDSDEEGDVEEGGKHAVISNDDLLYDPTMDDRDQRWVDRQRRRNNNTRLQQLTQNKHKKPAKLPTSDALLDCPACLTTLCLDCQRHDTYKHQYRAMFVMNCVVDTTQQLECPDQQTKRKKKKKVQADCPDATTAATDAAAKQGVSHTDLFNAVRCTECNTVVGVIDTDEVYHFFNILASHT